MRRILIIEDDQIMAIALRDGLESEGFSVEVETDGPAGLGAAMNGNYDLLILDIMLPRLSGFDVCKQLRAAGKDVPVVMLSARSLETEKVLGLKLGANDYITKPFSLMELIGRIETLLPSQKKSAATPRP